ncbi:hypothetical protein F4810DRAFT_656743 [Camillea tinctor]|nr:hypothetical protein F4810DRAFT_656743 [Camillea tinctor]
MDKTRNMRVSDMLQNLSDRLCRCLESDSSAEGHDHSNLDADSDGNDSDPIYEEDSDENILFDYDDGDDLDDFGTEDLYNSTAKETDPSILKRIRQDFRAVRDSGFKVGRICGFEHINHHNIVSASVRIDKLGLSEETLEAWDLASTDYIVLLINYTGGYLTYEDMITKPAEQCRLKFRVRKCPKYRPTLHQALAALSLASLESKKQNSCRAQDEQEQADMELSLPWVGESLDMFLDKELIPMMKLRKLKGVSWDKAKKMYSEAVVSLTSGQEVHNNDPLSTQDDGEEEIRSKTQLPPILASDALDSSDETSFPLVATQFALRYLIRCTEYCMICHEKVQGNFESLKPYVCGRSLCLFQYMSLGFGPSIDHEIINQPYVVDLLASFCYSSLVGNGSGVKMRELPTGLSISAPNIRQGPTFGQPFGQTFVPVQSALLPPPSRQEYRAGNLLLTDAVDVSLDLGDSTVLFTQPLDHGSWKVGQWVVLCTPRHQVEKSKEQEEHILHHGRIEWKVDQTMKLNIVSRQMFPLQNGLCPATVMEEYPDPSNIPGHLVRCNQNFDDLQPSDKAFTMMMLLATIPPVTEMRTYLMEGQNRKLATWDRITPAAMTLLRWVVASNRSYIVQVDRCPGQDITDPRDARLIRDAERISGVDDWVQFRLAQGSPEKEALFEEALKRVQKPQRTLVAWHGSPLSNWHSIIRHGLDYSVTAHGRAWGDGVYFSRDFDYSRGYSFAGFTGGLVEAQTWPQSKLKPCGAISLCELINLPEEFVQSKTCFVVQHCHWIQCRYLFVNVREPIENQEDQHDSRQNADMFIQDKAWVTKGPQRSQLRIPKVAIPSANEGIRKPLSSSPVPGPSGLTDSDEEEEEDINFLLEGDDNSGLAEERLAPIHPEPQTDFRPGGLDFSQLRLLAPPSYATEAAQRAIGRELQKLQKVQSTTPLHELGWYIDFEKVNNMFQWIVELHSFDAELPLAQDMKKMGVTSIVLEIRFLRSFPMSPPFVRVIRPRFLPFMNGGGGHVTGGGAMCMELLTNSGWSPANNMESVLLQVRLAMCNLEPKPARLLDATRKHSWAQPNTSEYGVGEAIDAYMRAAQGHGWEIPPDLIEASMEMRRE